MISTIPSLTADSFSDAFNSLPVGILGVDSFYTVLLWNRCLERWTKIERRAIIGKNLLEYYPHLDHPKYKNRVDGIFSGGPPVVFSSQLHRYVVPCLLNNGRKRIQHTTVSAVRTGENEYIALFSIQDVTELTNLIQKNNVSRSVRVQEAKVRKRLESSYLELEGKCRALFDASFDAVLILEKSSGRIVEANKAARALYGLSLEPGQPLRYLSDISSDPDRLLAQLKAGDVTLPLDYHLRPSGEKFAVQVRAYQFYSQSSLLLACFVRETEPEGAQ